jgi:hypothetical protein
MNFLYQAHSGLRYLVLLAGLAALVTLAISMTTNRPSGAAKGITAAFTGLLDLQVLLGIALVIAGIFYGALMGHLVMMVLAVLAAHGSGLLAKRTPDPRKATQMRLMGVVAALLLIVFGIMAIGRSVFGSAAPTVIG